jgi:hypothetical protein
MMPLDSNNWRCCSTDGSDIASGCASSLTDAGPRLNRSTMIRRVGSASAWNMRSRDASWLSICLSIRAAISGQRGRRAAPLGLCGAAADDEVRGDEDNQLDMLALHRVPERLVSQRTGIFNQIDLETQGASAALSGLDVAAVTSSLWAAKAARTSAFPSPNRRSGPCPWFLQSEPPFPNGRGVL